MGGKVVAAGPEVYLTPQAMQSLGLIMHELATNATKRGALSSPAGSVTIDWTCDREDRGVTIVWRERGDPPVTEPTHKGFGQVVFERIGASRDGDITTEFPPEGFVCTVTIAANNLWSGRHTHTNSPRHPGVAL
jgi:two-component sensor histidine kinase